jgi:hypothetical protein
VLESYAQFYSPSSLEPWEIPAYDTAMKKQPKKQTKPSLTGKSGDTPRLIIRVPDSERSKWQELADAAGLKLSAWIRDRLNRQRK